MKSSLFGLLASLSVSVSLLLGGCLGGETPRPLGFRCETDYDCAGRLVCRYGRCRTECTVDRDCPPDAVCLPVVNEPGVSVCELATEDLCGEGECPEGLECSSLDGECRLPCDDGDCPTGYACVEDESCVPSGWTECGDGWCVSLDENASTCPSDCRPICGDTFCTHSETEESCPIDCFDGCGDGDCDADEDAESCPADCDTRCGDGLCTGHETASSCPEDCPSDCGDGACTEGEDAENCPDDCGPDCGDGECAGDENASSCPTDCPASCPDGFCTHGENADSCEEDCEAICPDGFCTHDEEAESCPSDCDAVCPDGFCTHEETAASCEEDCEAICGDGFCTHEENASSCGADCDAVCPDGFCTHEENAESCSEDCDAVCPDGFCTHEENASSCGEDCDAVCPDGFCTHEETAVSCGADCPAECGDGLCTHDEDAESCPGDCLASCGDGLCTHDERPGTCVADCHDVLGFTAGNSFNCIRASGGSVRCWGFNDSGQLALEDAINRGDLPGTEPYTLPDIELSPEVVQVEAGLNHVCVILETGGIRCWGFSDHGRLGNPEIIDHYGDDSGEVPDALSDIELGGLAAVDLSCGGSHCCAALEDGTVRCWGYGVMGQLGNGAWSDSATPVEVVGLTGTAVEVTAGANHSCARFDDGDVRCWGDGDAGQLGDGLGGDSNIPVSVIFPDVVSSVVAGQNHTCAIVRFEHLYCWGAGAAGQLGTTAVADAFAPVEVAQRVVAVAAGQFHSCAIFSESAPDGGGVRCWGYGSAGRLGYGDVADRCTDGVTIIADLAVLDFGGLAATDIIAGADHNCAVMETGELFCWGRGTQGQLGHGSVDNIGDTEMPNDAGPVPLFFAP